MNNISDLDFFIALTRAGSLAAAGQQLGVTPSAVTKRLAKLEQRLRVRLVNRSTRRMSLTHEGEAYLADGARILDELSQLEQTLSGAQATPRGLLRVHATLGFGRRHIAPAMGDFRKKFSDVDVQLHLSDRPFNLVGEGFDLAIHIGSLPDARLTARRIVRNERILCASPLYLANAAPLATPADLAAHQCIVLRERDETYGVWHLRAGPKQEMIKVRGAMSTNDGETALCWALDGHGILMRSTWDVNPYLRSGRLQRILPAWSLPPADILAVYPTRQHLSAKTRACVDFLVDRFGEMEF